MDWIRQAEQDAPARARGFGGFLRQDLAAVTAGPTPPDPHPHPTMSFTECGQNLNLTLTAVT